MIDIDDRIADHSLETNLIKTILTYFTNGW
jgi:hypothetical protein